MPRTVDSSEISISSHENDEIDGGASERLALETKSYPPVRNDEEPQVQPHPATASCIADLIGEFGYYQLSLTIFTLTRYAVMAMMTNAGPLLAPDVRFWCQVVPDVAEQLRIPKNMTQLDYLEHKCHLTLINGTDFKCSSWTFDQSQGITLTDEFDLVCDRQWLRSAFQSIISIGVVFAAVVWGSVSDKHGRSLTLWVCFVWTMVASMASLMAQSLTIYAIARSLSTFGDLGSVASLSTLIVETLGNKYRGTVGLIVYTGWSVGVMAMPWVVGYYANFRHTMLFLMCCHLLSLPWLLTTGESARWLLVNGYTEEAKREIGRICRWNRLAEVGGKFDEMQVKFEDVGKRQRMYRESVMSKMSWLKFIMASLFGGMSKVGEIFNSRVLAITAVTIIWTTFNSELLYMLFVLINSDIGDNVKLNYAIGGVMETLATVISIFMVSAITRKLSLVSTLISISLLCFFLALTHQIPSVSIWILNLTKLAVSTLSSLVYVTTTEIYPTNLRQTGFGLSGTIGSFGAVVAPFIRTELVDAIGMTRVMVILMILPASAAVVISLYLRETKGVDLSDEVDELEAETSFSGNDKDRKFQDFVT